MTKLGARSALIAGGLAMPLPRSLFASNRAAAQSLITVSFSVTVNDQRIIISSFLATVDRDEVQDLTVHYPQRWHIEEFFKFNQALVGIGLYPQPQHPLRTNDHGVSGPSGYSPDASKTGPTFFSMGCLSPSQRTFRALEGDVRVKDDTIQVTYYNAPHRDRLRQQYENLPDKLQQEHRAHSTLAL